jgi:hypothetical protein
VMDGICVREAASLRKCMNKTCAVCSVKLEMSAINGSVVRREGR